jgi:putative membrane protein
MKKRLIFLALPFVFACNNGSKDSVEKADSANEAKSDTSNSMSNSTNKMSGTMAVDQSTSDFMTKTADGGMTEVNVSTAAKDKAMNQRVKDFAAMMVTDHSMANDELKSLAGKKNVTLPATVSDDHQKKMDDINKKSGKDYDKAYMDMMVKDHQSTVDAFQKASKDTKDADVKAWVDKTLPKLQMHLDSAKAIQKSMK